MDAEAHQQSTPNKVHEMGSRTPLTATALNLPAVPDRPRLAQLLNPGQCPPAYAKTAPTTPQLLQPQAAASYDDVLGLWLACVPHRGSWIRGLERRKLAIRLGDAQ